MTYGVRVHVYIMIYDVGLHSCIVIIYCIYNDLLLHMDILFYFESEIYLLIIHLLYVTNKIIRSYNYHEIYYIFIYTMCGIDMHTYVMIYGMRA